MNSYKHLIQKIKNINPKYRLKHLRGRHDQRDHAWNRGMGRGDTSGGYAPGTMNQDQFMEMKRSLQSQIDSGAMSYEVGSAIWKRAQEIANQDYDARPANRREAFISQQTVGRNIADAAQSMTLQNQVPQEYTDAYESVLQKVRDKLSLPQYINDRLSLTHAYRDTLEEIRPSDDPRSGVYNIIPDAYRSMPQDVYDYVVNKLLGDIIKTQLSEDQPAIVKEAAPISPNPNRPYIVPNVKKQFKDPMAVADDIISGFDVIKEKRPEDLDNPSYAAMRNNFVVSMIQNLSREDQLALIENADAREKLRANNLLEEVQLSIGAFGHPDARMRISEIAKAEDINLYNTLVHVNLESSLISKSGSPISDDELKRMITELIRYGNENLTGAHLQQAFMQIGPNKSIPIDRRRHFFAEGVYPPEPHPRVLQVMNDMYEETQRRLKEQGVTEVRLYRGGPLQGGLPYEPWSMDEGVAEQFSGIDYASSIDASDRLDLRTAIVPAEYIFSNYVYSQFHAGEFEFPVLSQAMYADKNVDVEILKENYPVNSDPLRIEPYASDYIQRVMKQRIEQVLAQKKLESEKIRDINLKTILGTAQNFSLDELYYLEKNGIYQDVQTDTIDFWKKELEILDKEFSERSKENLENEAAVKIEILEKARQSFVKNVSKYEGGMDSYYEIRSIYGKLIEKYSDMADAIIQRNNNLRTAVGTDENFALDKKYFPSTGNQPDYFYATTVDAWKRQLELLNAEFSRIQQLNPENINAEKVKILLSHKHLFMIIDGEKATEFSHQIILKIYDTLMQKYADLANSNTKSTIKERVKHLRGRHDQRDHAWNRGMGRGDSGGGYAPGYMTQPQFMEMKRSLQSQIDSGAMSYEVGSAIWKRAQEIANQDYDARPANRREAFISQQTAGQNIANAAQSMTLQNQVPQEYTDAYESVLEKVRDRVPLADYTVDPLKWTLAYRDVLEELRPSDNPRTGEYNIIPDAYASMPRDVYNYVVNKLLGDMIRAQLREDSPDTIKKAPSISPNPNRPYIVPNIKKQFKDPMAVADDIISGFEKVTVQEGWDLDNPELAAERNNVVVSMIQNLSREDQLAILEDRDAIEKLRANDLLEEVQLAIGAFGHPDARMKITQMARAVDADFSNALRDSNLESRLIANDGTPVSDAEVKKVIAELIRYGVENLTGAHLQQAFMQVGPNKSIPINQRRHFFANGVTPPEPHPRIVKIMNEMYEETQQRLKEQGVTEVRLYRGGQLQGGLPYEPWSAKQGVAETFSGVEQFPFTKPDNSRDIRTAIVPVEYIFSNYVYAHFHANEYEFPILAQSLYADKDVDVKIIDENNPVVSDNLRPTGATEMTDYLESIMRQRYNEKLEQKRIDSEKIRDANLETVLGTAENFALDKEYYPNYNGIYPNIDTKTLNIWKQQLEILDKEFSERKKDLPGSFDNEEVRLKLEILSEARKKFLNDENDEVSAESYKIIRSIYNSLQDKYDDISESIMSRDTNLFGSVLGTDKNFVLNTKYWPSNASGKPDIIHNSIINVWKKELQLLNSEFAEIQKLNPENINAEKVKLLINQQQQFENLRDYYPESTKQGVQKIFDALINKYTDSTTKSSIKERVKHLRGRHDQRDHAWNRGMGRGGSGGGYMPGSMTQTQFMDMKRGLQSKIDSGAMSYEVGSAIWKRAQEIYNQEYDARPENRREAFIRQQTTGQNIASAAQSMTLQNQVPQEYTDAYEKALERVKKRAEQIKDFYANLFSDNPEDKRNAQFVWTMAYREILDIYRPTDNPRTGQYDMVPGEFVDMPRDAYNYVVNKLLGDMIKTQLREDKPVTREEAVPIQLNPNRLYVVPNITTTYGNPVEVADKIIDKFNKIREGDKYIDRAIVEKSDHIVSMIQNLSKEDQIAIATNADAMEKLRENDLLEEVQIAIGAFGHPDARVRITEYAIDKDPELYKALTEVNIESWMVVPGGYATDSEIRKKIAEKIRYGTENLTGAHLQQAFMQVGPNKSIPIGKRRHFFQEGVTPPEPHPRIVKIMNEMYEETQQKLKEQGVTEVRLYRGGPLQGGLPYEPWSAEEDIASRFSGLYATTNRDPSVKDVRTAIVPVEYIFSTYVFSHFHADEWEFPVLSQAMYADKNVDVQIMRSGADIVRTDRIAIEPSKEVREYLETIANARTLRKREIAMKDSEKNRDNALKTVLGTSNTFSLNKRYYPTEENGTYENFGEKTISLWETQLQKLDKEYAQTDPLNEAKAKVRLLYLARAEFRQDAMKNGIYGTKAYLNVMKIYQMMMQKYESEEWQIEQRDGVLESVLGTDENFSLDKENFPRLDAEQFYVLSRWSIHPWKNILNILNEKYAQLISNPSPEGAIYPQSVFENMYKKQVLIDEKNAFQLSFSHQEDPQTSSDILRIFDTMIHKYDVELTRRMAESQGMTLQEYIDKQNAGLS